jgi:hypothetical protein
MNTPTEPVSMVLHLRPTLRFRARYLPAIHAERDHPGQVRSSASHPIPEASCAIRGNTLISPRMGTGMPVSPVQEIRFRTAPNDSARPAPLEAWQMPLTTTATPVRETKSRKARAVFPVHPETRQIPTTVPVSSRQLHVLHLQPSLTWQVGPRTACGPTKAV